MAYRKFSTKNADYVLGLMNHGFHDNFEAALRNGGHSNIHGLDKKLFEDIDALVLEDGGEGTYAVIKSYWDKDNGLLVSLADPRYQFIMDAIKREIPFYGTDADFEVLDDERRLNRILKSKMLQAFHQVVKNDEPALFSTDELNSGIQWFLQLGFYLEGEPSVEGRNAINAEKIERFVVDRVRQYSGKEKPKIGLVYGASHLGIENCLKSQGRRNKIIKRMRQFEGFDAEKFNQVQEARYNPEKKIIYVEQFDGDFF